MCLAYYLTCNSWVFVRPRSDWFRNNMSALHLKMNTGGICGFEEVHKLERAS